jgi:hypothetical protein
MGPYGSWGDAMVAWGGDMDDDTTGLDQFGRWFVPWLDGRPASHLIGLYEQDELRAAFEAGQNAGPGPVSRWDRPGTERITRDVMEKRARMDQCFPG